MSMKCPIVCLGKGVRGGYLAPENQTAHNNMDLFRGKGGGLKGMKDDWGDVENLCFFL